MSLDQFGAYVSWPRDVLFFRVGEGGAGPTNEAGPSTVVDED